jgi:hypothetical protein
MVILAWSSHWRAWDQSELGKSLASMSEFDWVHVGECLHLLCESRLVWEMYIMEVGSLQV